MKPLLAALLLSLSLPLHAAGQAGATRIDLGDGLAVERTCRPDALRTTCIGWAPIGFSFGDAALWLGNARTFTRIPRSGAILASIGGTRDGVRHMRSPALLRTDDGGAHWREVSWSGWARPTLFAFDDDGWDGVAIGDGGHVWSTRDGGRRWTDHGSASSPWVAVAIADRDVVLIDAHGNVMRSPDGGFELRSVVTDRDAWLEQTADEVRVHTASGVYRVRHGSPTLRIRP